MKVKHLFGPAASALVAGLPPPATRRRPEGAPITGKQWSESDANLKKAYLSSGWPIFFSGTGVPAAHMRPPDAQSLIPGFARGLQAQTLDSVRESLDNWYAANPAKMDRPVVETLWFEIVVPGTKRAP